MRASHFKLIAIVAASAALITAVELHTPYFNGTAIWSWPWRRLDPWIIYPLCMASVLPALLSQHVRTWLALLLLCAGSLGLELTGRAAEPNLTTSPPGQRSLATRIENIEENVSVTGYYTHAHDFFAVDHIWVARFLARYPAFVPTFYLHAATKPPGPILFYIPFIRWCSDEASAALTAGLAIGLLALLSVPATYLTIKTLTGNAAAAMQGAAYMSLCPGFVGFFPQFDQMFPIYMAAMVILWVTALREDKPVYSILMAAALCYITFQTYNLLTLGAVLIALPLVEKRGVKLLMKHACIVAGTCIALYLGFWFFTGFNPIATFKAASKDLADNFVSFDRPWPNTIPGDLADFLMGTGWLSAILIAFRLKNPEHRRLILICLLGPVLIAVLGIMQCETARVWIFMMPLFLVPVGLELAGWSRGQRQIVFVCLAMITAAIVRNMLFLNTPGM